MALEIRINIFPLSLHNFKLAGAKNACSGQHPIPTSTVVAKSCVLGTLFYYLGVYFYIFPGANCEEMEKRSGFV